MDADAERDSLKQSGNCLKGHKIKFLDKFRKCRLKYKEKGDNRGDCAENGEDIIKSNFASTSKPMGSSLNCQTTKFQGLEPNKNQFNDKNEGKTEFISKSQTKIDFNSNPQIEINHNRTRINNNPNYFANKKQNNSNIRDAGVMNAIKMADYYTDLLNDTESPVEFNKIDFTSKSVAKQDNSVSRSFLDNSYSNIFERNANYFTTSSQAGGEHQFKQPASVKNGNFNKKCENSEKLGFKSTKEVTRSGLHSRERSLQSIVCNTSKKFEGNYVFEKYIFNENDGFRNSVFKENDAFQSSVFNKNDAAKENEGYKQSVFKKHDAFQNSVFNENDGFKNRIFKRSDDFTNYARKENDGYKQREFKENDAFQNSVFNENDGFKENYAFKNNAFIEKDAYKQRVFKENDGFKNDVCKENEGFKRKLKENDTFGNGVFKENDGFVSRVFKENDVLKNDVLKEKETFKNGEFKENDAFSELVSDKYIPFYEDENADCVIERGDLEKKHKPKNIKFCDDHNKKSQGKEKAVRSNCKDSQNSSQNNEEAEENSVEECDFQVLDKANDNLRSRDEARAAFYDSQEENDQLETSAETSNSVSALLEKGENNGVFQNNRDGVSRDLSLKGDKILDYLMSCNKEEYLKLRLKSDFKDLIRCNKEGYSRGNNCYENEGSEVRGFLGRKTKSYLELRNVEKGDLFELETTKRRDLIKMNKSSLNHSGINNLQRSPEAEMDWVGCGRTKKDDFFMKSMPNRFEQKSQGFSGYETQFKIYESAGFGNYFAQNRNFNKSTPNLSVIPTRENDFCENYGGNFGHDYVDPYKNHKTNFIDAKYDQPIFKNEESIFDLPESPILNRRCVAAIKNTFKESANTGLDTRVKLFDDQFKVKNKASMVLHQQNIEDQDFFSSNSIFLKNEQKRGESFAGFNISQNKQEGNLDGLNILRKEPKGNIGGSNILQKKPDLSIFRKEPEGHIGDSNILQKKQEENIILRKQQENVFEYKSQFIAGKSNEKQQQTQNKQIKILDVEINEHFNAPKQNSPLINLWDLRKPTKSSLSGTNKPFEQLLMKSVNKTRRKSGDGKAKYKSKYQGESQLHQKKLMGDGAFSQPSKSYVQKGHTQNFNKTKTSIDTNVWFSNKIDLPSMIPRTFVFQPKEEETKLMLNKSTCSNSADVIKEKKGFILEKSTCANSADAINEMGTLTKGGISAGASNKFPYEEQTSILSKARSVDVSNTCIVEKKMLMLNANSVNAINKKENSIFPLPKIIISEGMSNKFSDEKQSLLNKARSVKSVDVSNTCIDEKKMLIESTDVINIGEEHSLILSKATRDKSVDAINKRVDENHLILSANSADVCDKFSDENRTGDIFDNIFVKTANTTVLNKITNHLGNATELNKIVNDLGNKTEVNKFDSRLEKRASFHCESSIGEADFKNIFVNKLSETRKKTNFEDELNQAEVNLIIKKDTNGNSLNESQKLSQDSVRTNMHTEDMEIEDFENFPIFIKTSQFKNEGGENKENDPQNLSRKLDLSLNTSQIFEEIDSNLSVRIDAIIDRLEESVEEEIGSKECEINGKPVGGENVSSDSKEKTDLNEANTKRVFGKKVFMGFKNDELGESQSNMCRKFSQRLRNQKRNKNLEVIEKHNVCNYLNINKNIESDSNINKNIKNDPKINTIIVNYSNINENIEDNRNINKNTINCPNFNKNMEDNPNINKSIVNYLTIYEDNPNINKNIKSNLNVNKNVENNPTTNKNILNYLKINENIEGNRNISENNKNSSNINKNIHNNPDINKSIENISFEENIGFENALILRSQKPEDANQISSQIFQSHESEDNLEAPKRIELDVSMEMDFDQQNEFASFDNANVFKIDNRELDISVKKNCLKGTSQIVYKPIVEINLKKEEENVSLEESGVVDMKKQKSSKRVEKTAKKKTVKSKLENAKKRKGSDNKENMRDKSELCCSKVVKTNTSLKMKEKALSKSKIAAKKNSTIEKENATKSNSIKQKTKKNSMVETENATKLNSNKQKTKKNSTVETKNMTKSNSSKQKTTKACPKIKIIQDVKISKENNTAAGKANQTEKVVFKTIISGQKTKPLHSLGISRKSKTIQRSDSNISDLLSKAEKYLEAAISLSQKPEQDLDTSQHSLKDILNGCKNELKKLNDSINSMDCRASTSGNKRNNRSKKIKSENSGLLNDTNLVGDGKKKTSLKDEKNKAQSPGDKSEGVVDENMQFLDKLQKSRLSMFFESTSSQFKKPELFLKPSQNLKNAETSDFFEDSFSSQASKSNKRIINSSQILWRNSKSFSESSLDSEYGSINSQFSKRKLSNGKEHANKLLKTGSSFSYSELLNSNNQQYLQELSKTVTSQIFNECDINFNKIFEDVDDFLITVTLNPEQFSIPQKTFEIEVIKTNTPLLRADSPKILLQALKQIAEDETLLRGKDLHTSTPSKLDILIKIKKMLTKLGDDLRDGRKVFFEFPRFICPKNVVFVDDVLCCNKSGKVSRIYKDHKRSAKRFKLVVFLLMKIYTLLMTGCACNKREIYYQIISQVHNQKQVLTAYNIVSCLLDAPPWILGIMPSSRGMVYGNLKLVINQSEINCNIKGGITIPQDIDCLKRIETDAKFILIVEKEAIYQKILDEDIQNKLTQPFILLTGKGYPDINTRLLAKKLSTHLKLPMFILVDADPYGIEIMLSYRFGSLSTSFLSRELALPHLRWLGIHPSEIEVLNIENFKLTKKDSSKVNAILKRPYMAAYPKIRYQLEYMKMTNSKAEIEGVIKCSHSLSNFYIPNKLCTLDFY